MSYADIIRNLRENNYYTQQYVASKLNVCQRTYCDYELGNTRIPIDCIIKLARIYDVDLNYICGVSHIKHNFPQK